MKANAIEFLAFFLLGVTDCVPSVFISIHSFIKNRVLKARERRGQKDTKEIQKKTRISKKH